MCGRVCTNIINAARVEECIEEICQGCVGLGFKLFFCFDESFLSKSTSSVLKFLARRVESCLCLRCPHRAAGGHGKRQELPVSVYLVHLTSVFHLG